MSELPNFDQFENCTDKLTTNCWLDTIKTITFNYNQLYYIILFGEYFYFKSGRPTFGSSVVITFPVHSDWNCWCGGCLTHTAIKEVEEVHHVYLTSRNCSQAEQSAIHSEQMQKTANKAANIMQIELPEVILSPAKSPPI